MRLRRKISIAFFLVSSLVSLLLAVFLYRFIDRQLRGELKARLRDIAHIGAQAIDLDAYQRLRAAAADLPADRVAAIEQSADYRRVYDQLNAIRDTEPELIRYAYILIPTGDPDQARFVVDADVLKGSIDGEDVSHFAKTYPVGALPLLRQALATCAPLVEEDFVHDDTFNVDSVSGYFPIAAHDGTCAGVLGLDITDKSMQAALSAAGDLAIKISLAVIALALLVSIAMGTVLTKSILALSTTVTRFANKDFGARTQIGSRDEIGKLGDDFNTMAETIQQHSENLEHLVEQRTSELTAEKENSERLLLNVLPGPIADRLKASNGVIVDRFEAVTVLFADLVGFTALSSRTSPEALVGMLDELFSIFDRLAEELGLEKIKTIGDAYMVVAGIPEPRADHALAIARMGLAMQAELRAYSARNGTDLTIRVGIHTGSVVAGVIGRKKFIYDLWGDTVNTASRMESHGIPGRVHVSEATYQLLRDDLAFEARGVIDIKGKGPMATYLVVDEAAPAAAEGA
ncbi:MAG: HAMP domain-containing protein [Deltaproteobacteria bacterium]|nr:HAMP domain-containing protein [Deltaproteobacteria bacterium]